MTSMPSGTTVGGREPEPVEPGRRQHGDVGHPFGGDLAEPGGHVAAELDDVDTREGRAELGAPAQRRRADPAPRRAAPGPSRKAGSPATSTSCASARSGTAPITRSSGSSAGRSLAECTARSAAPLRSASRIASIHRSLPSPPASRRVFVTRGVDSGIEHDVEALGRQQQPDDARPAPSPARSGGSRCEAWSCVVGRTSPSSSDSRAATSRSRAGSIALLEPDDRVVQELGRHAADERLDRGALVGVERGQPGAHPLELRLRSRSSPCARSALITGASSSPRRRSDPAMDLVADQLVGARDVGGGLGRVRGHPLAQRGDVEAPRRRGIVGTARIDVAGHGEVDEHQGPTGAAGHRRGHGIGGHHVAGRAGRRHDEVGVRRARRAERPGRRARRSCGRPARARARASGSGCGSGRRRGGAGASRRARPSGRRRRRRRRDRRGRRAPRRRGRCPARRTRRAPRRARSPVAPDGRPATPRGTRPVSIGAGAPPPSARGAAPRAPARGSASRRAPSSRARRRPRTGGRRRRAPSGRTRGRPAPRARRRASRTAAASAPRNPAW